VSNKYVVLSTSHLKQLLSPEDQFALSQILGRLDQARQAQNIPVNYYFTLNMNDKFALPAVDSYIEAIDESGQMGDGLKHARAAAFDARSYAIMRGQDKLPD
jgi:hypothetical protein